MICMESQITMEILMEVITLRLLKILSTKSGIKWTIAAAKKFHLTVLSHQLHIYYFTGGVMHENNLF